MHRLYIVLLVLAALMASVIAAACSGGNGPVSTGDSPSASLPNQTAPANYAELRGGNLHYRNFVLFVGQSIFFNSSAGQFCRADPDGRNARVLSEQACANLAFNGSSIFYTDNRQNDSLGKISPDGTNQVRIGSTPLNCLISFDDRLYAIEVSSGKAISLKTDGTGRKLLADIRADALWESDGLIYISGTDDPAGLIRYDPQSGQSEFVLTKKISSPNLQAGWLYYADPADNYRLRAWSLHEKTDWPISRFSVEKPFIVSQGYLYFINAARQDSLCRLPVNGRQQLNQPQPELVADDAVDAFAIYGKQVYYRRAGSQRIYRLPVTGGKALRIT